MPTTTTTTTPKPKCPPPPPAEPEEPKTHLVITGGFLHNWYTRVELFNFKPDSLQIESCNSVDGPIPDYPLKVTGAIGNVIDGKVTVCGGQDLITNKIVADCFQLDHSQVIWKPFPSLVYPRHQSGGGTTAQGWWVIGGTGDTFSQNTTEVYKNGAWQLGPNIPDLIDFWHSKPCVANINDTHTFVAGGNAHGDRLTAWIYNWLDESWYIQEFVPYNYGISSCVPVQKGTSKLIMVGYDSYYTFFNPETGRWDNFYRHNYCNFYNMMIMNGMPVTLYPGNRACTYNGTEWIVSQNTLTVDFNTQIIIPYTTPIQGMSCQPNVMMVTGQARDYNPPAVEVIPVGSSNEKCQLAPFPVAGFDVSLFLHKNAIVGCTYGGCYKLDKVNGKWNSFYSVSGYTWTSVEKTYYGMWKAGGANDYEWQITYCESSPQNAGYCVGNSVTKIHCFGNEGTIEGPVLPVRSYGHCTINLNETHTIIAGGLQTNSSQRCSSTPFLNGDTYCKSNQMWAFNWKTEEWTRLQDLPKPAAFATCGKVDITGKKFIYLYGQPDVQSSREGTFQVWSFEDETWSADVPQPIGSALSLPSK